MRGSGDLTIEELYKYANELTQRNWGIPFDADIELVNRKWKRCNGYLSINTKENKQVIKFSKIRNSERTKQEVLSTLLHELVHWRLYNEGKPFNDEDVHFVEECLRVGAPISGTKLAKEAFNRYQEGK